MDASRLPTRVAALLSRFDYFRGSQARHGGPCDHKEWQHFVVHTGSTSLLVNFNFVDEVEAGNAAVEVPRLVVLARRRAWDGDVERFDPSEVSAVPGRVDLVLGDNSLRLERGSYRVVIALRDRPIAAELVFTPCTVPALANNQILSRERSLSWFFIPRLSASGVISIGGELEAVDHAPAYHDHNWGRFRWGEDFSWTWGSVVPDDPEDSLGVVCMRMADRGRHVSRSQSLSLWRGDAHPIVFRDRDLRIATRGQLDPGPPRGRPLRLPRPMALLAPGRAHDIPAHVTFEGRSREGRVEMTFDADDLASLIVPSETDLRRVVTIHEVSGTARLRGELHGKALELEGKGVFEFVHP